ncbi:MAG: diacylglycerol kinase family lipid kinase [Clostridia bacterium]|nr:diacylglycerol kinase family lipid kinase [Clostridia bacterium]
MFHIIVNPEGGKGKSLKALEKVEQILKDRSVEYVVHKTERPGHATEITRELSKTPDTNIIMMGGDGSFNEILNGIENFDNVTLGIVPCGSGNDFIKKSGHPLDTEKALEVVLNGNVEYCDYIQLDDRRCLNVLGAGMDVDVLLNYATRKHGPAKVRYYLSLFHVLAHTRFHHLRLTVDDGEPMERNVFMIGVGNGGIIGGGIPICPSADPYDGELSIVVVNEMKKSKILFELPGFLSAKHVKKPYTEVFSGKSLRIEVLDDSKFEVDGEIFDKLDVHAELVHNQLRIFK